MTIDRNSLPGLNYLAPTLADDFEFKDDIAAQELLNRFQAIYGANFPSLNNYGIVSDVDPATTSASVLMIAWQSISDPFTYVIQPGMAVTPKGQLVIVPESTTVSIPQVNGNIYVIVANYVLKQTTPRLKLNVNINARREVDTTAQFEVVLLSDYLLRSSSQLMSSVVVGIVTVAIDPVTSILSTTPDLTKASYSFNRPWFSPVDVFHRNQKGNVHEMTLEELDQGGVPLMQKFLNDGFIIATDAQYPLFPGHLCVESIPKTSISSNFRYTLSRRPVRLGRLYDASDETIEYCYNYNFILNQITLLDALPSAVSSLKLDMLVVDSFEPALLTQTARFGNVSSNGESAISQGQPIRTMASFDVPLNNFGPGTSQNARIFVLADGTLVRSPMTLLCQGRVGLELPVDEDVPVGVAMPLPGVPRIIVRDNVPFSGEVVLSGTDVNGSPYQESIAFSFDPAYPDGVIPTPEQFIENDTTLYGKLTPGDTGCTLPPELTRAKRLVTLAQCPCRYGTYTFGSISSIRIANIVGGSKEGSITLQVLLDTRSLLYLAEVVESNGIPQNIVDNRPIRSGLSQVDRGIDAALSIINQSLPVGYQGFDSICVENLTEPKFADFRRSTLFDPSQVSSHSFYDCRVQGSELMYYVSRLLPVSIGVPNAVGAIQVLGSFPFTDMVGSPKYHDSDMKIALDFFFISATGISQVGSAYASRSYGDSPWNFTVPITGNSNAMKVRISGRNLKGFVLHITAPSPF